MAQLPRGEEAPADGLIPAAFDSSNSTFHAYVHIPYCLTRCGYCDFNTYTASELGGNSRSDYYQQVIKEIEFSKKVLDESGIKPRPISTIFFGGGTPTLLDAEHLIAIYEALVGTFGILADAEVTTEANPDSVNREYLQKLKDAGFTRVSFGMQSAVPKVLQVLERTHNPENVTLNVAHAQEVGLSTSVDLIYGSPGEGLLDWEESLKAAIALNTDHISAYSLIVEPGTKLFRQISSGELPEPDEDLHADMYLLAENMLADVGFTNYEVSNWAKDFGARSAHNIAYWQSQDWWGYGPGAHSHVSGVRWWNVKHPAAYSERISAGVSPALEREIVDAANREVEKVMLETRLVQGVDLNWLKARGFANAKAVAELIADELVVPSQIFEGKVVLTVKGRLLADHVIRKLLELHESEGK